MTSIRCKSKVTTIGSWTILQLPRDASLKLPSRGMVAIKGTLNGVEFETTLEPDGRGSHWISVDKALATAIGAENGDSVTLVIEPRKEWPEPSVPKDIQNALSSASSSIQRLWKEITPMARWDWIRWIRGTNNMETRKKRIEVALSKMKRGERRPCCFNRAMCTQPEISRGGKLIESI